MLAAATAAYEMGKSTVLKQTFLRGDETPMGQFQSCTMNLFQRAPLDKSTKGWVSWVQSDSAREIIAEYFSIQVKHFKKERAKSMEVFQVNYNIL